MFSFTHNIVKPTMKTLFLFILMHSMGLMAQISKWPEIQPLDKQAIIDFGEWNSDTPYIVHIRSTGGIPIYKLECHNSEFEDEPGMTWSGDFQCALFAVSGDVNTSTNLLAANTKDELSTDWWNRGRMFSAQLRGDCANFPEYSNIRHFKLRGMLVTLSYKDVEWSTKMDMQNNPMIKKFRFIVKVEPDPTAQSSRTELPVGPKPPDSCYP